jgi:Animal haem peroxidase
MKDFGHGAVGRREQPFTELLPARTTGYNPHLLVELSASIAVEIDSVKDGADAEENLLMPAGYTYLGQFIDHDLTFDNTSSLNQSDDGDVSRMPTNLRTPRFDLDSLYGDGPDAQPFMYGDDGASLLFKDSYENQCQTSFDQAKQDLLRAPNGRAIIGDKRNDENSIVSQIHLTFIKFHNAVVAHLKKKDPNLQGTNLFESARQEVRWAYQKIVIEDFLPRIVQSKVFENLKNAKSVEERNKCYALYTPGTKDQPGKRQNLPREFVVAAYRFGHSGVRFGYRLNTETSLSIFAPSNDPTKDSLLGFEPLDRSHTIDNWGRFFPTTDYTMIPKKGLGDIPKFKVKLDKDKNPILDADGKEIKLLDANGNDQPIPNSEVRLQFAYKIDPTLVDPLVALPPNVLPTSNKPGGALQEVDDQIKPDHLPIPGRPSLALLNLLRGNSYKVQGGQSFAAELKKQGYPVEELAPKYLATRQVVKNDEGNGTGSSKFVEINPLLQKDTPLWFYVLAEAQKSVIDELEKLKVIIDGKFKDEELLNPTVAQTQLGWVGGRIVAEVFYGLMDSDEESYLNQAPSGWQPIWAHDSAECSKAIFANLLNFAGQHITNTP